ncbi:MAG: helix-turn-helix transcriptional regulator [Clostridia bacterium]|nr:helix-turn-helix transcriptional regulator [Clostridia bacterium]
MNKVVYTLYSDEKNKITLTFYRENVKDSFIDSDSTMRFVSIINGNGEYNLGRETHDCTEGDSFVIPKGHSFTLKSKEEMQIFVMKFNLSDLIDGGYKIFNKEELEKFIVMLGKNTDKINGVHLNGKKIIEAMYMVENEFENKNSGSNFVIKSYLTLILSLSMQYYLSNADSSGIKKSAHYKSVERTLLYINENIASKITLEELSQIANMGKTNYSIAFKNATGMTVWEYIMNTRVELAASYLIEQKDDFNVTEVALLCGFNSAAHFSKTFKKLKGKAPSDYKRKQQNPCF